MPSFYIYQSESYTCYDLEHPNEMQKRHVKEGNMRILRVVGSDLFGMTRKGDWKHIVPNDPLRQVLKLGAPRGCNPKSRWRGG